MRAARDDGGPAFPTRANGTGMPLRDYFAAKALQGMLARPKSAPAYPFQNDPDGYAGAAYAFADAMIKARAA